MSQTTTIPHDGGFTSGLSPADYIDRLHAGDLRIAEDAPACSRAGRCLLRDGHTRECFPPLSPEDSSDDAEINFAIEDATIVLELASGVDRAVLRSALEGAIAGVRNSTSVDPLSVSLNPANLSVDSAAEELTREDWRWAHEWCIEHRRPSLQAIAKDPDLAAERVDACLSMCNGVGGSGVWLSNVSLLAVRRVLEEYRVLRIRSLQ